MGDKKLVIHLLLSFDPLSFIISIIILVGSLILCFNCEGYSPTQFEVTVEDSASLVIPVSTLNSDKVQVISWRGELIYMDGQDIVHFNYKTMEQGRDSFLRVKNYNLKDAHLVGVLEDHIILKDRQRLVLYNPVGKHITSTDLIDTTFLRQGDTIILSTGSGLGSMNRTYHDFVPLTEVYPVSFVRDSAFYVYHWTPEHLMRERLNLPDHLLDYIYKCNSYLLSPMIEPDMNGNGFIMVFSLSCRIFHWNDKNGLTIHRSLLPSGPCEINDRNFMVANSLQNFFPRHLPVFGNVLPDQYRQVYYQFYSTKLVPEIGERLNYMRVLDTAFQPVGRIQIDWDRFTGQLLILNEGVFLQSSATDKAYLSYYKLKLKKKE